MHDTEIQQRFHLTRTEIEATASLLKEAKVDLKAAIDSLRIEVEILKNLHGKVPPRIRQALP